MAAATLQKSTFFRAFQRKTAKSFVEKVCYVVTLLDRESPPLPYQFQLTFLREPPPYQIFVVLTFENIILNVLCFDVDVDVGWAKGDTQGVLCVQVQSRSMTKRGFPPLVKKFKDTYTY